MARRVISSGKESDSSQQHQGRSVQGRSVSSDGSRCESGGFVDARTLRSEDLVAKTLEETSGALGVITRPKVVDFSARLKERRKANTRMIVMRVAAFVGAVAAIVALVWLLFFSSVFRLESSGISVVGANEWVKIGRASCRERV